MTDHSVSLPYDLALHSNAIRNDLQHPNEYIRGSTLRFLQKVKEPELLEPPPDQSTVPRAPTQLCPQERRLLRLLDISAQRKLIVDAPELMETFLAAEADTTANATPSSFSATLPPSVPYSTCFGLGDQVASQDELMQLAVIELIRKDCRGDSPNRPRYIRAVSELLAAPSHSVKYEAAITLTTLTQNAAAVKATASALIELIVKESDNNVKLIVLDRLDALRTKHEHVIDPLVMDLLRVLSSPDMDVRRKALRIASRWSRAATSKRSCSCSRRS